MYGMHPLLQDSPVPVRPITVLSNQRGEILLCYPAERDALDSLCPAPIVLRPVEGGCLLRRCGRDIGLAPPQSLSALITASQVNIGYADHEGVHFVDEVAGRIRFDIRGTA